MLTTLERWLWRLFRCGIGVSFAVLVIAVLIQVVGRIVGASPVWTEELTRFALLYVAAFGGGLALKSGDLVNVDVLCESFGERLSKGLRFCCAALTALLCAALILPAWKFVAIGMFQTSPALGLKMAYVHFSVVVFIAGILLFALFRLAAMLIEGNDGRPDNAREPL